LCRSITRIRGSVLLGLLCDLGAKLVNPRRDLGPEIPRLLDRADLPVARTPHRVGAPLGPLDRLFHRTGPARSSTRPPAPSPRRRGVGHRLRGERPVLIRWAGPSRFCALAMLEGGAVVGSVRQKRRSFAVVSPGMNGQTTTGKRAPMLGKWPNPNKLSGKGCPGWRTLDQESPGSSPGGAIEVANRRPRLFRGLVLAAGAAPIEPRRGN
jgi:hypothetical protein